MNDRYIVQENEESGMFDIYDAVRGDRLFCSFPKKPVADEVAKRKNAEYDAARLQNFKAISYKGSPRTTKNDKYQFPKMQLKVTKGLTILSYD